MSRLRIQNSELCGENKAPGIDILEYTSFQEEILRLECSFEDVFTNILLLTDVIKLYILINFTLCQFVSRKSVRRMRQIFSTGDKLLRATRGRTVKNLSRDRFFFLDI